MVLLLYNNHIYNTGKNLLYALPIIEDMSIITLAKYYESGEIEGKTYKDSIQDLFPNKEANLYDQMSDKKYIFLNNENIHNKRDLYILLTIYTTLPNSKIKLITSDFDSSKILLPYNTEKLIYFKENIKFYLPYNYKEKQSQNYLINIKSIQGSPKLIKDEKNSTLKGNNYIQAISNPHDESFQLEYVENKDDDKNQGILITYDKLRNDKLFNLEINLENDVSLNGANSFPQYIYTPLSANISMKVKYSFHDISYVNEKQTEDLFKITGVIIDKEKLKERIRNSGAKIEGNITEGSYSSSSKKGSIFIEKNMTTINNEYYLYVTVDKDSKNKNEYKTIGITYTPKEGEEKDKEEKDKIDFIDGKIIALVACSYIVGLSIIIGLIVLICVKCRKRNDVRQSNSINNEDSLLP